MPGELIKDWSAARTFVLHRNIRTAAISPTLKMQLSCSIQLATG
jgi:hypothetical protein